MLLYIGNRTISLDLQEISKSLCHFLMQVGTEQRRSIPECLWKAEKSLTGYHRTSLVSFKLYKFHKNASV